MNRILVIRGGAIGDFILTLPAIKALRDANPNAHIEILGYQHIAALAENRLYAQPVRSIESAALARFFAKNSELPADLAKYFAEFDLIVSYLYDPDLIFEKNLRRSGARRIMHGPAKIGIGAHATHQLMQPIRELGLSVSDFAPKLFPSNEDRHRAGKFLKGSSTPIVAFHPGSGSEQKNWPIENWFELGNRLLANFPGSLIAVSGEADEPRMRQIESVWQNPRVRFAKNLPLTQLAALLGNTIFLGHDSGISHLAAAAGARCILLFGQTDPAVWAPLNEKVRILRAPNGDLRQLGVDLVYEALDHELMRIGINT